MSSSRLALAATVLLLLVGSPPAHAQPAPPPGWDLIREPTYCGLGREVPGAYVAIMKFGQTPAFWGGYSTSVTGLAVIVEGWPTVPDGEAIEVDVLKEGRRIWTVEARRVGGVYLLAPNDDKGLEAITTMLPVSLRPARTAGPLVTLPIERRDGMAAKAWMRAGCRL
jgi:hypothetical protein